MTNNDAYFLVADVLGMKPRESLIEAARRFMRAGQPSPVWRVAHAILHADNDSSDGSWRGIFKAAKAAKAIARQGRC